MPPGTYRINTLLFNVSVVDAVAIPPGKIGVVEARDGKPLRDGRIIARQVECDSFQSGQAFIDAGGERGPQMAVMSAGTYRINPSLFAVSMDDVVDVPDDKVGVVMTREGKPLAPGEIAGPTVSGHNTFQNPQAFVDAGGSKGLQEQVLLAGRYFINPRFATVELVDMVEVPIAERQVAIAEFAARATVKSAEGEGEAKKINAEADANVLRTVGDAQAAKTKAVGEAEAEVIRRKIDSMEAGNYAVVQVADALAKSGTKLVPDIVAGDGSGNGRTLVDVLLAGLIRDGVVKKAG